MERESGKWPDYSFFKHVFVGIVFDGFDPGNHFVQGSQSEIFSVHKLLLVPAVQVAEGGIEKELAQSNDRTHHALRLDQRVVHIKRCQQKQWQHNRLLHALEVIGYLWE